MNVDKYGLLGQIQTGENPQFPAGTIECGDQVKWEGDKYYITGEWSYAEGLSFSTYYKCDPVGTFCRCPHPELTYNGFGADYRSGSRDQRTGRIAGLIRQNMDGSILAQHELNGMVKRHRKSWYLFADNTIHNSADPKTAKTKWYGGDLTGPEIWAMQIRALPAKRSDKWKLPLYDLQMLVNTWLINRSEGNECISYLIKLFVSVEHKPTWASRLALRKVDTAVMMKKLVSYWSGWRDQPEMPDLYASKLITLKLKERKR